MKKIPLLILVLAAALASFSGCRSTDKPLPSADLTPRPEVKYIFLLIGDGYGPNQRAITEALLKHPLEMSRMTATAATGTNNVSGGTTDSAASGTAIATGVKTYNSAIGVDGAGNPVESLASKLQRQGFKIGLISSSPLTDATPAAHYSHRASRGMTVEIGQDMAASGFDFFGGAAIHNHETTLPVLEEHGYTVLQGEGALALAQPGVKSYVLLQPYVDWTLAPNRELPEHTLAGYLAKAIELLDNPNGFFIMLENGHIDYSGHHNDAGWMIREVIAFDEAVQVALEFQKLHPAETLIVVTADHETGGLLVDDLQSDLLPVLLKQQGGKDWIISRLRKLLDNDPTARTDGSALALVNDLFGRAFADSDRGALFTLLAADASAADVVATAAKLRDARLGFGYSTGGHSSAKIITNAQGPGAERFAEPLENSDLPHLIASIALPEAVPAEYLAERAEIDRLAAVRRRFGEAGAPVALRIVSDEVRRTRVGNKTFDLSPVVWERFAGLETASDGDEIAFIVSNSHPTLPLRFGFAPGSGFQGTRYLYAPATRTLFTTPGGKLTWDAKALAGFTGSCVPETTLTLLLLNNMPEDCTAIAEAEDCAAVESAAPVIEASVADAPPAIDGSLADAAWATAKYYAMSDVYGKELAEPAEAAFLVDPEREIFYLGVLVPDREITWSHEKNGAPIWEDDCIEFFLASSDQQNYYHLIVNPFGAQFSESALQGAGWRTEGRIACERGDGYWSLEMALPLEQFGLTAAPEGNLCRNDQPAGALSNLSPTLGGFHNRRAFIPIDLGD